MIGGLGGGGGRRGAGKRGSVQGAFGQPEGHAARAEGVKKRIVYLSDKYDSHSMAESGPGERGRRHARRD